MRELSKSEILGLSLKDIYLEFESIKEQIIGIPIYLEQNQETRKESIDFELRNSLYEKVKTGFTISIHITDIINSKYTEKWKQRLVYFGDYNNRRKCDYYKFQDEIIKRKALMTNIVNTYYNYKEKNYR